MQIIQISCRTLLLCLGAAGLLILSGCGPEKKPIPPDLEAYVDLNTTVGTLVQLLQYNAVPVRGFGVVAGLNGTGSAECPPALRAELERYIRQQLPKTDDLNPRKFLDSSDTAVVEINGVIPALARQGQTFDVQVTPISRTQTTSLDGGYLYTALLKERSIYMRYDQYARTFATAQGQLFRDTIDTQNSASWYLLGGGIVQNEVQLTMALYQPNFRAANAIRNRINERFGSGVAQAISAAEVRITIPPRFQHQKDRFIRMLQLLYLSDDSALRQQYIEKLLQELQNPANATNAEIGLESIGKSVIDSLYPLLSSQNQDLRFHVARCMLNIGDDRALPVLEPFCKNTTSPYCLPAIEAVGQATKPRKAEPILLRAVESVDLKVRLAAYNQLDLMKSPSISRNLVADSFLIDRVFCGGPPMIYVYRSEFPKIVLFASPIQCSPDIFLLSDDGNVTLNAKPGDKYVSISRKHPSRPRVIGPIHAGRELSMLIRAMGENADLKRYPGVQPGLSLPYQDIIRILKKMSDSGAVQAGFQQGPMSDAGAFLENLTPKDR